MEFSTVIKERYSCKKYSDKPLEEEKLTAILEAGRLAPTARNAQVQRVYVLSSKEAIEAIDRCTPCRYGAPVVLALSYDKNNVYCYGNCNSGSEDCAIVATHMMLAAADLGVNSCWLNKFEPDLVKKEFNIPEDQEVVMLLDLGYTADQGQPLPNHFSRKPLEETVKYL